MGCGVSGEWERGGGAGGVLGGGVVESGGWLFGKCLWVGYDMG